MNSLPLKTKFYLVTTYFVGFTILGWHLNSMEVSQPWLLITLCILASFSLVFRVEGSTRNSHYSFNFLVYGFTFAVLGTSEAIIVIIVSNIVEMVWNKQAWYVQLFNISCYVISIQAAGWISNLINPVPVATAWQAVLSILFSMSAYNLLNHLMIGIVLWLARGENFKKSGIFDFFPFMLDLALLVFGASLSFVWEYNAYGILLFSIPLYLIYSTLRVPALERKTEIDPKTGLFNHEYFKKHLSNELARANRFDRPISVILADLDLLRNINNTYGHLAGDDVLIGIAHAMKNAVREYDVVCRFGGEEFAILLPETDITHAFERAEIIRKKVEELEFSVSTSITPIKVTISLGVAHRENFSQSQEEIIHNADLALYHSKLSGRNRTFAFTNDTYLDLVDNSKETAHAHPQPIGAPVASEDLLLKDSTHHISQLEPAAIPSERQNVPTEDSQAQPQQEKNSKVESHYTVTIFISGLALLAALSTTALAFWVPYEIAPQTFDWLGLIMISSMIILSEIFSIDLYARQSSISTSAIPILVAYLLFGTLGIVLASLVLAISLLIKFRSPFNRFVFNLSNHLLSGTLIVGLVTLTGRSFLDLPAMYQVGISILAAGILYLVTTWMVALGMGLDLKQPIRQLWNEQFSWLAPYYLGIGLITYALIFGYKHDHVTGLLLMTVPMFLLRISQMQYIERTRDVVTELRDKNQILKKTSQEISDLNEGLLVTLSEIIDLRDPYVLGHSKQVSTYAANIAKQIGLNEKQTELIRKAGLLHDIGKLGIPTEILGKPSKLTKAEYETVKEHAALGGDLVKNSPSLRPIAQIIRHHHERYDGNGYPDRIEGSRISIEARIVAVADAMEAMTSDRPYRKALKHEKVLAELMKHSGTQFDPLVVDAAIKVLDQIQENESAKSIYADSFSSVSGKLATDIHAP